MQKKNREPGRDSVLPDEGLFRAKKSINCSADADGSVMPEVYRPCAGTWAEFVGDIKTFIRRTRSEWADRIEGARETWSERFHPNRGKQQLTR